MATTQLQYRDSLIEEYKDYARGLVKKLIKQFSLPSCCFDELEAAGYLGLVEAAKRYDKTYQNNFPAYAYFRIRGAIVDELRRNSFLSASAYKFLKAYQACSEIDYQEIEHNRNKTLAAKLAKIMEQAARGALIYRLSIEECKTELVSEENLESRIEENSDFILLIKLIKQLNFKEQVVIKSYYFEDKNFAQIAKENEGISKSWVTRLHEQGIRKLRELYEENSL